MNQGTNYTEKRDTEREDGARVSQFKIVFASATPNLLGRRVKASTVDISASGIGIMLNTEVPIGSTLDFNITLAPSNKTYFLSAEVRRCNTTETNQFNIGLDLDDRTEAETDIDSWRSEFE